MRRIILGFVAVIALGCAGGTLLDPFNSRGDRMKEWSRAYDLIHAMQIGMTSENEFSAAWYGTTDEQRKQIIRRVAWGVGVGPISSPRTYESSGYRTRTYYIGRRNSQRYGFSDEYLWAVTFVNGLLESIYTY